MGKGKREKISEISSELAGAISVFLVRDLSGKMSFLAAGLEISAKGTKHEQDARELITMVCPEYFDQQTP